MSVVTCGFSTGSMLALIVVGAIFFVAGSF